MVLLQVVVTLFVGVLVPAVQCGEASLDLEDGIELGLSPGPVSWLGGSVELCRQDLPRRIGVLVLRRVACSLALALT